MVQSLIVVELVDAASDCIQRFLQVRIRQQITQLTQGCNGLCVIILEQFTQFTQQGFHLIQISVFGLFGRRYLRFP